MENLELGGDDVWNPLLAKSGVLHGDEYVLSDDHYRIFDTCTILYNVLDYIQGPSSMQKDFKGTDSMFPEEYNMDPLFRGGRYYRKNYRQPIFRHFYNLSVNYRYRKK